MYNIYIDVETTGVSDDAGIWQIGVVIEDTYDVKTSFLIECNIFDGQTFDTNAADVTGLTRRRLKNMQPPQQAYKQLVTTLGRYVNKYDKKDKFTAIGYNCEFDQRMLRNWFLRNGDQYFGSWFWFPWWDMMNIVAFKWESYRQEFPSMQLQDVMRMLNIVPPHESESLGFHNALFDAQATRLIYHRVRNTQCFNCPYVPNDDIPF